MPDPPVAVPPAVAEQARQALAERARTAGIEGASRAAVMCAMELSQSPFVPAETLRLVGAWHAANAYATTPDGRCTRLAGLYGGAAGRRWALEQQSIPAVSWLPEESATLDAFPQAWPDDHRPARAAASTGGAMIALYPDDPAGLAVDGGDPESELHVTLAFLAEEAGDLLTGDLDAARAAAASGAEVRSGPLTLQAIGAGCLGDSEPPATVLILQQMADDGSAHQDGVSAVAAAVRAELNDYGSEKWPAEHDGFIPHLTIGYGVPLEQAQALVGQKITFTQGPTLVVDGEREAFDWVAGEVVARAAAAKPAADPMAELSQRAQAARAQLEERVLAAAQVAMRDALRRAGVKVTQRASRRSNAAKAAVAAANGRFTPAVLAAVGMTEADLIRQSFDSLGERYEAWVVDAAAKQMRAVAAVLGLPADEVLARMQLRVGSIASAATLQLTEDLTKWAYRLLADPVPTFGDVGEVPVDPTLPRSLVQKSLALADGRGIDAPYGDGLVLEAWLTYDPTAPIEVVTWDCGSPARPFPPHQNLCGSQTEWADYAGTYGADAGDFPRGETYWFPGDHIGCECSYSFSYRATQGVA